MRVYRQSRFFRFIDDHCQRVFLRAARRSGEHGFNDVDAGLFQLPHGGASFLIWNCSGGHCWAVRWPRLICPRWIDAQWSARTIRRTRQLNESGREEPRAFNRAGVQTPLQFHDLFRRIAAGLNRGEAAVEEFLHAGHGFFF